MNYAKQNEPRSAGLGQKIEIFSTENMKLNVRRYNFPLIPKAPTGLYLNYYYVNFTKNGAL